MSLLVHIIANERASKCQNVRTVQSDGIKLLADVNGKKFLLEHGSDIKGWAGFPYYGMGRMKGREAARRMNTRRGFDYSVMGHFHVPAVIEGSMLVNGSLSGTSELDHAQGRHADPAQVAFLVHPHHGVFNWTPQALSLNLMLSSLSFGIVFTFLVCALTPIVMSDTSGSPRSLCHCSFPLIHL